MAKFVLCLLILLFSSVGFTQPPPAAARRPSDKVPKTVAWESVESLPATEAFSSLEGRFKIALPEKVQGYGGLSQKQTGGAGTGEEFRWKFAEAEIRGFYLDLPNSNLTGSAAELVRLVAVLRSGLVSKYPMAKLVSEGNAPGSPPYSFYVYDLGSEGFTSAYFFLDRKRIYQFNASFKDRAVEDRINRAIVTFELLSQQDVDAEFKRKYEEMKPLPLPQTPAVIRLTSDAQDEGLKGNVWKIVEESENKGSNSSVLGRKMSSIEYYDKGGALTQRDSYDYRGNPFEITIYGYIDGKRVSKSKMTSYEYDPPPMMVPAKPSSKPEPKRDPRYDYSFDFKYENGKIVERQMIFSNGKKGMRYVYKHSPNQFERLVYTEEGTLNQRYVSILDANGNEIEKTNFGLANFHIYGDRKYKYAYEFDSKGNWIKKVTSTEVKENGVTRWEPSYITYRTITYY